MFPKGHAMLEPIQVHYPGRRFTLIRRDNLFSVYDVVNQRAVDTSHWPQQLRNELATKWKELCRRDFTMLGGQVRVLD